MFKYLLSGSILFVLIFVSFSNIKAQNYAQAPMYSQKNVLNEKPSYPNSFLNACVGFGSTYGGLGVKAVGGYRNSGLVVGLGTWFGYSIGYSIGGQISAKWWYASITYGTYALSVNNFNGVTNVSTPTGISIMTGGMINLGKPKRFFIDLGIGLSTGGTITQYNLNLNNNGASLTPTQISYTTVALNVGFGVRLGDIKEKAYIDK